MFILCAYHLLHQLLHDTPINTLLVDVFLLEEVQRLRLSHGGSETHQHVHQEEADEHGQYDEVDDEQETFLHYGGIITCSITILATSAQLSNVMVCNKNKYVEDMLLNVA